MKKSLPILALLVLCSSLSNAQIRMAFAAGGHQSDVLEKNNLPDWSTIKNYYSPRTGVHLGFMADIPLSAKSHFSLQPGVYFFQKGRKYEHSVDSTIIIKQPPLPDSILNTTLIDSRKQFINYIDIPVNLVLKLNLGKKVKFILGGGPYVSFFFNGFERKELNLVGVDYLKDENTDLPVGKKPGQYEVITYGANAVAGFEFKNFSLTGTYQQGLTDFYRSTAYDGSFKHTLMGATLTFFLGKGVPVEKKVKDRDNDGIPDAEDACPTDAGTALTKGCPDKDGDGTPDKDDKCPDIAGLAKYNGCPVPDKDKDGVNDELDKCPDVAGSAKYNGCPVPDKDKDGVNDELDKCPDVAGLAKYDGCPTPDRDHDGIDDDHDKCPDVAGTKEQNGCPEIKKEVIEKINYAARKILFKMAVADLQSQSLTVLDEVVKILNEDKHLTLTIEGHTNNDGDANANMKLSKARAEKVKAYLISKGIDASRLTAIGYGPTRLLTKGRTPDEKAQNRRVELKLSN